HLLGDREARAEIPEGHHFAAVDLSERLGAPVVVGQRDDRVRVRVNHRLGGQEAVKRRLDGRARAGRLEQRVGKVVDHRLIVHVRTLEQRADVVDARAGEILLLDALEIGAAALDAQHAHLAAAVVALDALDRRVAAAPHDERGLRSDEAGRVHEQVEIGQAVGGSVVPARVHGDTIPQGPRRRKPREGTAFDRGESRFYRRRRAPPRSSGTSRKESRTMKGLIMDYPLTLTQLFERARRLFHRKTLATRVPGIGLERYTYADYADRGCRLA